MILADTLLAKVIDAAPRLETPNERPTPSPNPKVLVSATAPNISANAITPGSVT